MADTLQKLRPDRDLQCYWLIPSAIAALSQNSPNGFTVSGSWRQQFDWAVIEWNRDNIFEHPLFRNLPDGDLSGLRLSYQETRTNCVPMDSSLYPTVDWPYLRIWADNDGAEQIYWVPLRQYATALDAYEAASAEFALQGTPTANDYVGLCSLGEYYTYQLTATDALADAINALANAINANSKTLQATPDGQTITLFSVNQGETSATSTTGSNGNRMGAYGFVSGAGSENWQPQWQSFAGGVSPANWSVRLDFSSLTDRDGNPVPTSAVRKMRWTYAADLQAGAFERSEFSVTVSNWTVAGTGLAYSVAGPGSRRIEDDDGAVVYSGNWQTAAGNFSGGSIHSSGSAGASLSVAYASPSAHWLYLGVRELDNGASISIDIDGQAAIGASLDIPGEDVLVRIPLGQQTGGSHTVTATHTGPDGALFYFDFLEIALPTETLPAIGADARYALATDWDTAQSMALAPERTAWMISSLGFHGRVNHYAGAMWFYEMVAAGYQYASGTVEFSGSPSFGGSTQVTIGQVGQPSANASIVHVHLIGDSAETVAIAFEQQINSGYTAIWAQAEGSQLTIFARAMGSAGGDITISGSSSADEFSVTFSGATLSGGVDGNWLTDLEAMPRLNRAARDWSGSFFAALASASLVATASFSTELQYGDPSLAAGIAQRYPSGEAVMVSTPALQTNFSPESLAFWQQVYLDMAGILSAAGQTPYLQFGEVQWWYFPGDGSGMPFYDAYTTTTFESTYGRAIGLIADGSVSPALFPQECEFLPNLIGEFTTAIMAFVRMEFPNCRFEVLYPVDVNDTPLNQVINLPSQWQAGALDCFKTESFTYTSSRNLEECKASIEFGLDLGFAPQNASHLIGVSDPTSPWLKEARLAAGEQLESVVLFALDQFCLIGYAVPLGQGFRRSLYMG